jgi:SAM-dependent methyltransferase
MSIQGFLGKKKEGLKAEMHLFHCPVCNKETDMTGLPVYYLRELQKYQSVHNIFFFETLNLEHYHCANCGASDRDRLYALFLRKYLADHKEIKLLDIAPAAILAKFIRSFSQVNYCSMDLYMKGVDDNFDITDMHGYLEGQFDVFICSHVLEHIPDDRKAMLELYRVLKPGGTGIAMVPINLAVQTTLEDPAITDIPGRWKYFGQEDHVRMYAKNDFIARLQSVGFTTRLLDINYFGADLFERSAVYPTSVLYLVNK